MSFGAIPGMEEALGRYGPCCASDATAYLEDGLPAMKFQWLGSPPIYMPLDGHFITRPTRSLEGLTHHHGDQPFTKWDDPPSNRFGTRSSPGRVSAKELPKNNEVSS